MIKQLFLFIDGSAHPKSQIGYGGYIVCEHPSYALINNVEIKRFEQTTSTRLEIQTLLWALSTIQANDHKLTIYTDCQGTINLLNRRQRLEDSTFENKKGVPLNNADLYRLFYRAIDSHSITFEKVKGHKPTKQKGEIDRIFSLVDKATRKALREAINPK